MDYFPFLMNTWMGLCHIKILFFLAISLEGKANANILIVKELHFYPSVPQESHAPYATESCFCLFFVTLISSFFGGFSADLLWKNDKKCLNLAFCLCLYQSTLQHTRMKSLLSVIQKSKHPLICIVNGILYCGNDSNN